jgi:hypothetical protein
MSPDSCLQGHRQTSKIFLRKLVKLSQFAAWLMNTLNPENRTRLSDQNNLLSSRDRAARRCLPVVRTNPFRDLALRPGPFSEFSSYLLSLPALSRNLQQRAFYRVK